MKSTIRSYTRREHGKAIRVPRHSRTKRGKSKHSYVGTKPVQLYPVYDEYHQFKGWKRKRA